MFILFRFPHTPPEESQMLRKPNRRKVVKDEESEIVLKRKENEVKKKASIRYKHMEYAGIDYCLIPDKVMERLRGRSDCLMHQELFQETYLLMIPKEVLLKVSKGEERIWNKIIGKKRFAARDTFVLTCKKKISRNTWIVWYDDYLQAGKEFEESKSAESPIRGVWYNPKQLEKTLYNGGYGDITIEYRETDYVGVRYRRVRMLAAYNRAKKQTVLANPPATWIAEGLNKGINRVETISRAKQKEDMMLYVSIGKDIKLKMASANDLKAMENATARAAVQATKRDDIIAATKARFGIGARG